ncbi:allatostatin-A receptor-like [Tubulanus polymorphus]|uniref:allatostatin-A receptor-like n=1 Tax=Tubulanus polymorphus TaxID=672921 RepID=UPI003DA6BE3E
MSALVTLSDYNLTLVTLGHQNPYNDHATGYFAFGIVFDSKWIFHVALVAMYGFLPFSFVVGTVGNLFALRVLSNRHYTRTSTGVYMIALEVFDTTVVSLCVPVLFTRVVFQHLITDLFCKIYIFLLVATASFSNLTLAFMSIDRLIVVCFPFKAKSICTPRKARVVLLAMVLAQLGFSIYRAVPLRVYTNGPENDCDYPLRGRPRFIISFTQNVIQFWIPFGLILGCNISIVTQLVLQSKRRKEMTNSCSDGKESADNSVSVTLMLLSVSILFLVLHFPFFLYRILKYVTGADRMILNVVYWISRALMAVNSAINFYVYCLASERFRVELRAILNSSFCQTN